MTPHEVMSMYLKGWAFTAYSDAVQVHDRRNIGYARAMLAKHGLGHIRVTFV